MSCYSKILYAGPVIDKIVLYADDSVLLVLGGAPPRDSTLVTAIEERISKHSYIVFSCLASSGIVLAVLFGTFNVIHREKK